MAIFCLSDKCIFDNSNLTGAHRARLAQRKEKRLLSSEPVEKEKIKTHDIKKTITLEDLTNPNQK